MFSCGFWKVFKNTCFVEHLRTDGSEIRLWEGIQIFSKFKEWVWHYLDITLNWQGKMLFFHSWWSTCFILQGSTHNQNRKLLQSFLVTTDKMSLIGYLALTGPAKGISKWRCHGTLKRIVDMIGRQEKFLNFRCYRMAKTITFRGSKTEIQNRFYM